MPGKGMFGVEVIGAEKIMSKLEHLDVKARERTSKAINRTALEIHREAVDTVQHGSASTSVITNTGQLARSIHAKPSTIEHLSAEVVAAEHYAAYVEFGTGPHWAPLEPLMEYVARKWQLGMDTSEAYAAAKGLQNAIAQHGTMAHPFLNPAVESQRLAHRMRVKKALDEAVGGL